MANRAVFLDRDGTMAKDVHYCSRPADFELRVLADEAKYGRILQRDSRITECYSQPCS